MNTSPVLENYLSRLDSALGPIALSERAEIVLEIKSHILDAQQRDPSQRMTDLLASLGEPEQVASRYLLEKGFKPHRAPRRQVWKWLLAGTAATFAIALLIFSTLLWRFSPIISVNDETDRVILLGGLIDIDGQRGSVHVGGSPVDFGDRSRTKDFKGSKTMPSLDHTHIEIPFSNGSMEVANSGDRTFSWSCRVNDSDTSAAVTQIDDKVVLNLGDTAGSHCKVRVPELAQVKFEGRNGKLSVEKPAFHLDAKLSNGKVSLSPDPARKYHFQTSVGNGKSEAFDSSPDRNALRISVNLGNGKIARN